MIGIANVCANGNYLYFIKFESCILNSIGARSIPVSKQAGRQADKTLIKFENFEIV